MIIRPALPAESRALSSLAIASKSRWPYTSAQLAAWMGDLQISVESISREPTFVAEEQSARLGFAQLRTRQHPWTIEEARL